MKKLIILIFPVFSTVLFFGQTRPANPVEQNILQERKKLQTEQLINAGDLYPSTDVIESGRDLFDLLFEFPQWNAMGEYGVVTDGEYIYTSRWNNDEFYRYDMNGNYVETFFIAGAANLRDLTYDGTYFYGSPGSSVIYEMCFETETLISTFTTSATSNVHAIAYDAEHDGFWVSSGWNPPLTLIDRTGNVIKTLMVETSSSIAGLGWDNYSDGGAPYLWIYSHKLPSRNFLKQIDIITGAILQTFDVATVASITPFSNPAGGLDITDLAYFGKWAFLGASQNDIVWCIELTYSAPDDAPGAATDLTITPGEKGALYANLSWTNPDKTAAGDTLTELDYIHIYRDESLIHTIENPQIGGNETYHDDDIAGAGLYTYMILCENSAGKGSPASKALFIGEDAPAAPGNIELVAVDTNGLITWDAPTEGHHGGYFTGENITYTVVRFPCDEEVATNITEQSYFDTGIPVLATYYYTVTSYNHMGEGGTGKSNSAIMGPPHKLPFYEDFTHIPEGKIPGGWKVCAPFVDNWNVNKSNNAGGEPPEMQLYRKPTITGKYYLKTPEINTSMAEAAKLSFKHSLFNWWVGKFTLKVVTIVGDKEYLVDKWVNPPVHIPSEELEYILIPSLHGVGAENFQIAWVFDGDTFEINWWCKDDILLTETIPHYYITFNVMENSPEGVPVEGATITIDDKEEKTDPKGIANFFLPDACYTAIITAWGYEEEEITFTIDGKDKTIEVYMKDDITVPFNLKVFTEHMEPGEALFYWNVLEADWWEFRYDDGDVHSQLGYGGGFMNSVMGAAHHYDAALDTIRWYLTGLYGPHHYVNIWVFGLDADGFPDSNYLLYSQMNVPNIDNQWNYYEFPKQVEAPHGFFIGLSYEGFLSLALDNGIGPPWEYIPNTQFAVFDYTTGDWKSICHWGHKNNFMLRAYGEVYGEIRLDPPEADFTPEINKSRLCENSEKHYLAPKPVPDPDGEPYYPGKSYNHTTSSRSFLGWNVFLNNEKVAAEIDEKKWLFTGLQPGKYIAGVQSVYTTGLSEIVEIEFEIDSVAPSYTVTFNVMGESGDPIMNATVTFDNIQNDPGDYVFENIEEGTYNYTVEKEGYHMVEGQVYVDDDITVEVTMYLQTYLLSLNVDPVNGGVVHGEGDYNTGEEVEIIAEAYEGWEFVEWTGDIEHIHDHTSATTTVTMPADDVELTANFDILTCTLTLYTEPAIAGTVDGEGEYSYGEVATITATANAGWEFENWTDEDGTVLTADSIYSFVVEEDKTLTANFQLQQFEISAEADPPEGGTVTGAGEYYYGDTAELIATSNTGYDFINWKDEEENVLTTDSIYSFVVEKDRNFTANFQFISYVFPVNNVPITLYPNPFRDYLNIQIPRNYIYAKTLNVEVYNMTGELVYHKSMPARQDLSINLTALKPGTYTLVIVMDRQQITKRIMKLNK